MSENPENPYGQPKQEPAPDATAQPAPYGQPAAQATAQQAPSPYGQQPGPYAAAPVDPGKTLSIVAIILPFVGFGLVGMILGFVAKSKSKKAGFKNTVALWAIIIGALSIVATIVITIVLIAASMAAVNEMGGVELISKVVTECTNTGAESVVVDGTEYSCAAYN